MRVFEKKVLRRIYGQREREEQQEAGQNCRMSCCIICIHHQSYYGDQMNEDEIGVA
jgi:hypothetical protein